MSCYQSLDQFIAKHRDEIDECIRRVCKVDDIDDDERELWVLNDEPLYDWAYEESVIF